jgi:hypothetical protein
MDSAEKKQAFIQLGRILCEFSRLLTENPESDRLTRSPFSELNAAVLSAMGTNPWFTLSNIRYALQAIGMSLQPGEVDRFYSAYRHIMGKRRKVQNIGVIMAGNLPLVGFHDFLCVVLSGHRFIGKLSSDDEHLLPAISRVLGSFSPDIAGSVTFIKERLTGYDAVIATGSNNTSRYFEYYFRKHPHIIRKNRHGVAVLNGRESEADLSALGEDVFIHFGRGCRNVSKIYLPASFSPERLFDHWERFSYARDHHKYRNNYDYYKSVFLVSSIRFYDNGFLLIKEDTSFGSPVAVLHFEHYTDASEVNLTLKHRADEVQCVVSIDQNIENRIPFGKTQQPSLTEYADGIDTMEFLLSLGEYN